MSTTRVKNGQAIELNAAAELGGFTERDPRELDIVWNYHDPYNVGQLQVGVPEEPGDLSRGRFMPTPGRSGVVTIGYCVREGDQVRYASETFEVEGGNAEFVAAAIEPSPGGT